jgi:hypothetical protein
MMHISSYAKYVASSIISYSKVSSNTSEGHIYALTSEEAKLTIERSKTFKEQHRVKIPNRLTALEVLGDDVDINRTWETIRESIKISAKGSQGYYELKKHKPWSD